MAIVINEFEIVPVETQAPPTEQASTPAVAANEPIDIAQTLAQLEERRLRLEAN